MVGATIVLGSTTLGEGYHRVRGSAHAEVEALTDARARGNDVRGATMYVTLEPCNHAGLTPPCSLAVVDAGIARVVIGALDADPRTQSGGVARLREAGIVVDVAGDDLSRALVEEFSTYVVRDRPYVRVKLASSLDGFVAPRPGERHWLTGEASRDYVRELRASYDAVLVGAGTVRIDDPQLNVRPPRARRKPYVRVIACEDAPVPAERAIFAPLDGYAKTIVLAPAGKRAAFAPLEPIADVAYVGGDNAPTLDLRAAMRELRKRGIATVLCEGGPTLAARLLEAGLVDRVDWLVAPVLLCGPEAVPVLANATLAQTLRFERVAQLGPDALLAAVVAGEASCSAD
jgi:diaminohydroxyphosphoribosylaminopyrimidine deaminase/5-amino-6-(5-phosphoribosylamino)uracil reductase